MGATPTRQPTLKGFGLAGLAGQLTVRFMDVASLLPRLRVWVQGSNVTHEGLVRATVIASRVYRATATDVGLSSHWVYRATAIDVGLSSHCD